MSYTTVYFTAAVYKVVNNVETFKYNMKFFVPFDNSWSSASESASNEFQLINALNINKIFTYRLLNEKPSNWPAAISSPYHLLQDFGHMLTIDEFENSIMRLKIDEHRRIDISFLTFTRSDGGCYTGNNTFSYYYDNSLIYSISLSGVYNNIYTTEVNGRTESVIRTIPFPSPDGTRLLYTIITGHISYDKAEGEILGESHTYSGTTDSISANLTRWLNGFEPPVYDEGNPYIDGGTSEPSDSEGNFSEDSDSVDLDNLPTIDAVGTGFATLFTPTKAQLKALADIMWDSNVFTALQNLVENIQKMFTSLAIVPFTVTKGATAEVTWFGLAITEVFLDLCSQQYYDFDMGSINLANDNRIFTSGSALDYSPYSKLGIFLPFIGYQDLDIDECRDAVIGLKYRIDILSGACVALVSINGNTIYQFTGNCLSQIPITNENMQSLVTDAVNVGIAAAATHSAMGAASADMTAAEGSTKISQAAREAKIAHAEAHVASSAGQLSSATANAAMGMKPTYGKAGAISASASLLAVKQPYLFLTTPRQSLPDHYQKYCGFPSNITGKLNSFSGFTVVEDIRLNGLVATSPEVAEIYELLKKGVII